MKQHIEFDIEFLENKNPAKFIALEGIDGSGKSTQTPLVVKALEQRSINAIQTKEPTSGPIGKFVYEIFWEKHQVEPAAIQHLLVADRVEHHKEIISHLSQGKAVVTDRYFWSGVAYGIMDIGEVPDYLMTAFSILSFYHRFTLPDITFYLDIDVDTAYDRVLQSGKKKEIYKNRIRMIETKKAYEFLLQRFPEQFVRIDSSQSIEQVTNEMINHLKSRNILKD